jgi:hypothetical protein
MMKILKSFEIFESFEMLYKFWYLFKLLKFWPFFAIWLADRKWNLVSGWTTLKPWIDPLITLKFFEIFEIWYEILETFWNIGKFWNFEIWLADWKWNLVSGWTTLKPWIDPLRLTRGEPRKYCLGQSVKSQIPYHLIMLFLEHSS